MLCGDGGRGDLRRMKGGMRSEAIADKSDIKAGVVAEVQHRVEQKADWGGKMKILQPRSGRERRGRRGREKNFVNM